MTLPLVNIGRHFYKDGCWFVVARDENEGRIIETFKKRFIEGVKAKTSVYYDKKSGKEFAQELQEDFKKTGAKKYMGEKL